MASLSRLRNLAALLLCATALSGCIAYGEINNRPHDRHPAHAYNVPEGHIPPPGECRIWFPDRPPGQQPPPGNCYDLERRIPSGASLVRG